MVLREMLGVTIECSRFVDSHCPENGDEGTGRPEIHSLALFFFAPGARLHVSPTYRSPILAPREVPQSAPYRLGLVSSMSQRLSPWRQELWKRVDQWALLFSE